ncbi:hypothetical protein [Glycomyces niveus]|uniref:Uncharacterized protein n=1 Tax=Glycomyces niveus TaxID=2820287 RepID=A0ABS3U9K7_9ACTN|nr:hypothetical protein [Glycomyces sp. NEAU-S30]MBO3735464.1 hypothetical protein [Glycomyces sp. NEAU-S30]
MRRRKSMAAAAVSGFAVAGLAVIPFANANANESRSPATAEAVSVSSAAVGTVVLPTGDRVTMASNGVTGIEPAAGREDVHFLALTRPSGDRIVVPSDKVEAIRSGEEDARRYNVTQLLEGGHTDAAAVPAAELDGRDYDSLVPAGGEVSAAADTQKLTIAIADTSGAVPDGNLIGAYNAATGEEGYFSFDEQGVATAELPQGEYLVFGEIWNEAADGSSTELVMGITAVTLANKPVKTEFNGADASPVTVEVDQPDAVVDSAILGVGFQGASEVEGTGSGITGFPGPDTDVYVLPEPEMPEGPLLDFIYQPMLSSPAGAAEPYLYNLAFGEIGGYPEDLSFYVSDDELAVEKTTYNSFGTDLSGTTCDSGNPTGSVNGGWCLEIPTDAPSTRTDYRSAGPEVEWSGYNEFGVFNDEGTMLDGFADTYTGAVLETGDTAVTKGHGLFGAGAPEMILAGGDTASATTYLYPAVGYNDENVKLVGYSGTAELSLNGEVLGGFDGTASALVVDAALTEAGRYTLTTETTRGTDTVPFGTSNTSAWSFDLDPNALADGEESRPSLPVVAMRSDGVESGYAAAAEPLDISLDLAVARHAAPVIAESMTFQVSYDDGASWTEVPLDFDGCTATATLEHPEGAEFASTRFTATDDAGTEVEQTTIRSFGLK